MSNEVDYYDVQSMIGEARAEIRGEIQEAVRAAREELSAELDDLNRTLSQVIDSRTAHLA